MTSTHRSWVMLQGKVEELDILGYAARDTPTEHRTVPLALFGTGVSLPSERQSAYR